MLKETTGQSPIYILAINGTRLPVSLQMVGKQFNYIATIVCDQIGLAHPIS